MKSSLEDEVRHIISGMDEQQNGKAQDEEDSTGQQQRPLETIHIHYFPDAIVILKEENDNPQPDNAVETTFVKTKKPPVFIAYATVLFYLLLILSCIAFQLYEIRNPPIATITIIPKSHQVSLTGTLQLGRFLNPITLSQSATAPTTGRGHQDAKAATGFITFYNGQLTQQFVPARTILTGSDGVQIATDQDALIPQASPPTEGQITVSAHAMSKGMQGNIAAKDINEGCCATAVLAVNLTPFQNGQKARDFQIATRKDINSASETLKHSVKQSMQGALHEQLKNNEALVMLVCTPAVSADHRPGQEATEVKVTESLTCLAIAYNTQELESKATQLLSIQAIKQLGTGYMRIGAITTSITKITGAKGTVTLSFSAHGTWVYQIQGENIKERIAGKKVQEAERILRQTSGIKSAIIENAASATLPKQTSLIHIVIFERS